MTFDSRKAAADSFRLQDILNSAHTTANHMELYRLIPQTISVGGKQLKPAAFLSVCLDTIKKLHDSPNLNPTFVMELRNSIEDPENFYPYVDLLSAINEKLYATPLRRAQYLDLAGAIKSQMLSRSSPAIFKFQNADIRLPEALFFASHLLRSYLFFEQLPEIENLYVISPKGLVPWDVAAGLEQYVKATGIRNPSVDYLRHRDQENASHSYYVFRLAMDIIKGSPSNSEAARRIYSWSIGVNNGWFKYSGDPKTFFSRYSSNIEWMKTRLGTSGGPYATTEALYRAVNIAYGSYRSEQSLINGYNALAAICFSSNHCVNVDNHAPYGANLRNGKLADIPDYAPQTNEAFVKTNKSVASIKSGDFTPQSTLFINASDVKDIGAEKIIHHAVQGGFDIVTLTIKSDPGHLFFSSDSKKSRVKFDALGPLTQAALGTSVKIHVLMSTLTDVLSHTPQWSQQPSDRNGMNAISPCVDEYRQQLEKYIVEIKQKYPQVSGFVFSTLSLKKNFNDSYDLWQFSAGEFSRAQPADKLLEAIRAHGITIPLKDTTIKKLNALLHDRNLYLKLAIRPPDTNDTIRAIREGEPLSLLATVRLNRLLFEANFPNETPRSKAHPVEEGANLRCDTNQPLWEETAITNYAQNLYKTVQSQCPDCSTYFLLHSVDTLPYFAELSTRGFQNIGELSKIGNGVIIPMMTMHRLTMNTNDVNNHLGNIIRTLKSKISGKFSFSISYPDEWTYTPGYFVGLNRIFGTHGVTLMGVHTGASGAGEFGSALSPTQWEKISYFSGNPNPAAFVDTTPINPVPAANQIPAPVARCGDGIIQSARGEFCDDGNNKNNDGCNSVCRIESQYTCVSQPSQCAMIADRIPPSIPSGLTVQTTTSSATISWRPSTDNRGVIHRYEMTNASNQIIATIPGTSQQISLNALKPATSYPFKITAVDLSGNKSSPASITCRTQNQQALPVREQTSSNLGNQNSSDTPQAASSAAALVLTVRIEHTSAGKPTVKLTWPKVDGAVRYTVTINGVERGNINTTSFTDLTPRIGKISYTVDATNAQGTTISKASAVVNVTLASQPTTTPQTNTTPSSSSNPWRYRGTTR